MHLFELCINKRREQISPAPLITNCASRVKRISNELTTVACDDATNFALEVAQSMLACSCNSECTAFTSDSDFKSITYILEKVSSAKAKAKDTLLSKIWERSRLFMTTTIASKRAIYIDTFARKRAIMQNDGSSYNIVLTNFTHNNFDGTPI